MGYSNEQLRAHIYEAQEYLYVITINDEFIPVVIPDGIFGEQTCNAVRAFQKKYRMPISGEIDYTTWQTLVYIYSSIVGYDI